MSVPYGYVPGYHIPGTFVPIAAIHAEEQRRALQQQQMREAEERQQWILLAFADDDDPDGMLDATGIREGGDVTVFAMLEFRRFKRWAAKMIDLSIDEQRFHDLTGAEATVLKTAAIKAAEEEAANRREPVRLQREAWLRDNTRILSGGVEQVRVTAYKLESQQFEEIEVEGDRRRVDVGEGQAILLKLAEERFPYADPVLPEIQESGRQVDELRSWSATWSTADSVTSLTAPNDLEWQSIPTQWVLAELNRLSAQGWQLVQTSIDRGIYTHSDAPVQGGPVTLRYMFSRPLTDR